LGVIFLHHLRREPGSTQAQAEAVIALAAEHGFVPWLTVGMIWRGWALAVQGQGAEGIGQLQEGRPPCERTGQRMLEPWFLALLAEAHVSQRALALALHTLDEALGTVAATGERFYEAELYRLKGELLQTSLQGALSSVEPVALSASSSTGEAEACLQQALDMARRQGAKAWELRAAMSLARLWQQHGKRAEARALLAEVYGWFTEGFDTADLQEAGRLLEELASTS